MDRKTEQMFSILNTTAILRNYPPLVCKFLDKLTAFFHARLPIARRYSYLLEQPGFRNLSAAAIGLPIALPLRAAKIHYRKGKD
jgi:hypothetical protein